MNAPLSVFPATRPKHTLQFLDMNIKFRDGIIHRLPHMLREDALKRYQRLFDGGDHFTANTELRHLRDSLQLKGVGLSTMAPRESVQHYAEALTKQLSRELAGRAWYDQRSTTGNDAADAVFWLAGEVSQRGFEFPFDLDELSKYLRVKDDLDAEAISQFKGTLAAAMARVLDPVWWVRRIVKEQRRRIENVARQLEVVHRGRSPYVSQWALSEHQSQKTRNRRILESLVAENQDGQAYTLQELSDLSVSNPELRRNELMTRLDGFQAVADELGDAAALFTVSTPSRFHRIKTIKVPGRKPYYKANPKWKGATVKDGQKWLVEIWAKIRSALERRGVRVYGFRIAEPHHDGTPHWHILLFFAPKYSRLIPVIFRQYARGIARPKYKWSKAQGQHYAHASTIHGDPSCNGYEPGAEKHRVDVVYIDKSQGSAVSYLAKYISKNIDGYGVDYDHETHQSASSSAQRVAAWASVHGIRQFQQVGGPSVGVWRELRRIDSDTCEELEALAASAERAWQDSFKAAQGGFDQLAEFKRLFFKRENLTVQTLKALISAADAGLWSAFVQIMGGPVMKRKDRPVQLDKQQDGQTVYGEDKHVIKGIVYGAVNLATRLHTWSVTRMDRFLKEAEGLSRSSVNNCTREAIERWQLRDDFERGAGFS